MHKVVPVKPLTAEGYKELPAPYVPGINRKAGKYPLPSAEHLSPCCLHDVFD